MNQLTILSFGGGQDSTAILYKLLWDPSWREKYAPDELMVVFSDTGNEHPETYSHLRDCRQLCVDNDVPFVWVKPEMGFHSASWQSLVSHYRQTNTCGAKAFVKSCSDQLKIRPIYRWLSSIAGKSLNVRDSRKKPLYAWAERNGRIRMLLGIAKGEETRVAKTDSQKWMRECIEKVYPLIDYGMDRAACQRYIRKVGQNVPLPSNCMLCPFISEIELLWLYRRYPQQFQLWCELEANKLERFKDKGEKNFAVWGRKTLREKLAEAETKHGHMSDDEVHEYKMSHGHCVRSKY